MSHAVDEPEAVLDERPDVDVVAGDVLHGARLGAQPQEPSSIEAMPVGERADKVVTQVLVAPARVGAVEGADSLGVEPVKRRDGFGLGRVQGCEYPLEQKGLHPGKRAPGCAPLGRSSGGEHVGISRSTQMLVGKGQTQA